MGFLKKLFRPQARIDSSDALWKELLTHGGYGLSKSGMTVTPQTAMACSAVFACINVIAQTVAQLPLILYRKTAQGKEKAVDHPLYNLLGLKPNSFLNSMNFREMMTAHYNLRGNSFAFINRVGNGRIFELLPLHPDCVSVYRDPWTWEITYNVSQKKGITGVFTPKEIFHVMGMTLNGYRGITPLSYARETIGLSLATEKFGAQLFGNGAKPGGILTYPGKFKTVETAKAVGKSFDEAANGDNAQSTIVLEDGMTWNRMSLTSEDSQFLETRQFQIPEIARFFRMPLHKIQDLSKATFSNIEQQALEFLTDCMLPHFVRWESALNTQLLTTQEQQEYFFKFDIDDILRADMQSRYAAYSQAVTARILNPNECREKEDMNPYPGGDSYENPAITPGKGGASGA